MTIQHREKPISTAKLLLVYIGCFIVNAIICAIRWHRHLVIWSDNVFEFSRHCAVCTKHFHSLVQMQLTKRRKNSIFTFVIRLGGVAQLVERLNGIQEVRGSTPLISTSQNTSWTPQLVFFFYAILGKLKFHDAIKRLVDKDACNFVVTRNSRWIWV